MPGYIMPAAKLQSALALAQLRSLLRCCSIVIKRIPGPVRVLSIRSITYLVCTESFASSSVGADEKCRRYPTLTVL